MRALRTVLVFALGVNAGIAGAAALMRRVLVSRGDETSDELSLVAVFEGVRLTSRSRELRGGSMLAWYGGIDVDLSEAELAPGARLQLTAIFGGISVRIPPGWRVERHAKAFMGGIDVRELDAGSPDAPTLVIDGLAVFGGISVGAKKAQAESANVEPAAS